MPPLLPSHLRFFFLLMVAISPLLVSAQQERWVLRGQKAMQAQDYPKAIEYFEWATKKEGNLQAYEGLGNCYWEIKAYNQSVKNYRLATEYAACTPLNYFFLGRALLANQNPVAAEKAFKKYAATSPHNPSTAFAGMQAYFPVFLEDSANFVVKKLPFNSALSDFGPAWYENGIAFSSARKRSVAISISTENGTPLIDLWYCELDSNGEWSKPRPISALNSILNEGPLCIDSARNKLYITRNLQNYKASRANKGRLNKLQIFEAELNNGEWSNFQKLPFGNSNYPVGHPTLSPDGQQMYFAGEFPDGIGGTDIYVVDRQGDFWGLPRNLGPLINTPGDELFPSSLGDGTLIFASDGHLGLGGLDLFSIRPNGKNSWSHPQNLGYPMNTYGDDFGYISKDGGRTGYFSSNRGGKVGNDNIYAFKVFRPSFDCEAQQVNNYCYQFTDDGIRDFGNDTVAYLMEWNLGNGVRLLGDTVEYCFPGPGSYRVTLSLIDTLSGLRLLSEVTYDLDLQAHQQAYIEGPDTVATGESVFFHGRNSAVPNCNISKYYWEFSDGRRAVGESVEHIFARPGQYQVRLGVEGDSLQGSHTCLSCVFRDILVLPSPRLQAIQDSISGRRALQMTNYLNNPAYRDSLARISEILQTIRQIRNSNSPILESPKKEPVQPIHFTSPNFQAINSKENTASSFPHAQNLPPAQNHNAGQIDLQRYGEEIVVEWVEDGQIWDGNPPVFVRIPAKIEADMITIFPEQLVDDAGKIVSSKVSMENLKKGLRIVHSKVDSEDKYWLELAHHERLGYFQSQPNFSTIHYQETLGIPQENQRDGEVIVHDEIGMMTIKEIFEQGISVRIRNIFFDRDSGTLRPESYPELDRLARILIENPHLSVEIMGHTDSDGNAAYNMTLSHKRAVSVLRYLVLAGYDVGGIQAKGYGKTRPVAPNLTPRGKQLNRRVEFRLTPK